MLRFIRLALKYMARRKLRTAVTTIAIMFGVMVLFGTWTALPILREAKVQSIAQTAYSAGNNETTDDTLDLSIGLMNSFGVISLFVGGFLIFNTYRAVLAERQHDLALLRIIGASRRHIAQFILTEALLQGIVGTLLGLISGWLLAGWLIQFIYATGIFPNIELPPLPLPQLSAIIPAIGLGIGTALASAYLPARRAGMLSPLVALHPISPDIDHRLGRVSGVIGIVCLALGGVTLSVGSLTATLAGFFVLIGTVLLMPRLLKLGLPGLLPVLRAIFPRTTDIAYGNLMRQRSRSGVTANSLMVGFAVFIASVTLVDSMHSYLIRLFTFHLTSDYLVVDRDNLLTMITSNMDGSKILDPQMIDQISALPQVEAAMGVRVGETVYQGQSFMLVGIDPAQSFALRPIDFATQVASTEEVLRMLQENRTLLITVEAARKLGIQLGDPLPLTTLSGTRKVYTVIGVVADMTVGTGKLGVVLAHHYLAEDFGIHDDLVLYFNVASNTNPATLRQFITGQAHLVEVGSFRELGISGVTDVMKSVYVFAAIVIIPALLGLINTLTINVFERTREIGMMRAIGSEQSLIQHMVLVETLFLTILGGGVGILVGVVCGASIVSIFSPTTLVPSTGIIQFQFPMMGILFTLIVGPVIALLTSIIPARRAAHLNIIEALRFE